MECRAMSCEQVQHQLPTQDYSWVWCSKAFLGAVLQGIRGRSASPGFSNMPLERVRPRWGTGTARYGRLGFAGAFGIGCSGPLGFAGTLEIGCSRPLELAAQARFHTACRLRWGDGPRCYLGAIRKEVRERCASVATRSEHLAVFVFAPSIDIRGSAIG